MTNPIFARCSEIKQAALKDLATERQKAEAEKQQKFEKEYQRATKLIEALPDLIYDAVRSGRKEIALYRCLPTEFNKPLTEYYVPNTYYDFPISGFAVILLQRLIDYGFQARARMIVRENTEDALNHYLESFVDIVVSTENL